MNEGWQIGCHPGCQPFCINGNKKPPAPLREPAVFYCAETLVPYFTAIQARARRRFLWWTSTLMPVSRSPSLHHDDGGIHVVTARGRDQHVLSPLFEQGLARAALFLLLPDGSRNGWSAQPLAHVFDQIVDSTQRQTEDGAGRGGGLGPFVFAIAVAVQADDVFGQHVEGDQLLHR